MATISFSRPRHRLLAENQTLDAGPGRHQVQRRAARSPVPGAPRRLAVDGDDLSAVGAQTFHPGDEGVPERRVIQAVEQVVQCVMAGNAMRKG